MVDRAQELQKEQKGPQEDTYLVSVVDTNKNQIPASNRGSPLR